jgi:hypothetical protein
MASWTGITAVTAYSPVLLKQAGYGSIKQAGLAGGLNTIGMGGSSCTSAEAELTKLQSVPSSVLKLLTDLGVDVV